MNPKVKGYLLGFAGGLFIAPDALVSKLLDIDIASFIFWRSFITSMGFLFYLILIYKSEALQLFKKFELSHCLVMLGQIASPTGFVIGIKTSSAVSVLVIFALTPILSSIWSWLIFNKKIPFHTLICMVFAIAGVLIVTLDSSYSQTTQTFTIPWGEIATLIGALCLSFSFCFANANPNIRFLPVQFLGTFVLAVVMMPFNHLWQLSAESWTLLLISGFLVQATASTLLIFSTRFISSTETALMMLIETTLGPILVWIFINEEPTKLALIGGISVLISLLVNISLELKNEQKKKRLHL